MVGENSIGMRLAWRSFQAAIGDRHPRGLEHRSRAPGGGFLFRGLAALILHLVKAYLKHKNDANDAAAYPTNAAAVLKTSN